MLSNVFFKSKGWIFLILPLLLFAVNGVKAEEVSSAQRQALVQKIKAINQALEASNIGPLVDALPPRFYREMALRLQLDVKALQDDLTSNLQQQFESDGMNSYRFDSSAISYHEAKTNEGGHFYALVPTRVEVQDTITNFHTLALYDDESWYLIQGGQKPIQNPVFLEIYPFLSEITMPPVQNTKKQ